MFSYNGSPCPVVCAVVKRSNPIKLCWIDTIIIISSSNSPITKEMFLAHFSKKWWRIINLQFAFFFCETATAIKFIFQFVINDQNRHERVDRYNINFFLYHFISMNFISFMMYSLNSNKNTVYHAYISNQIFQVLYPFIAFVFLRKNNKDILEQYLD